MIGRLLSWWRARRDRRLGELGRPHVSWPSSRMLPATTGLAEISDQVNALIRENAWGAGGHRFTTHEVIDSDSGAVIRGTARIVPTARLRELRTWLDEVDPQATP